MNDHLITRLLLLLMLLNGLQLMLLVRMVLHLSTDISINARIVVIHFSFYHEINVVFQKNLSLFTFYSDESFLVRMLSVVVSISTESKNKTKTC